jgi:hypothetical protein
VWLTTELAQWFFDLATVEEEVRRDIRKYDLAGEALTPRQAAVRIRTHPSMAITSAAKMKHAVKAEVSYGGTKQQTILFEHTDSAWLAANLEAARRLLAGARAEPDVTAGANRDGRPMLTNVPSALVLHFLTEYALHPQARTMLERQGASMTAIYIINYPSPSFVSWRGCVRPS